jgi:predicted phage terminase large subunit-like protein
LEEIHRRNRLANPTPAIRDKDTIAAENSLEVFCRRAWHIVEPHTDYLDNWHIGYISEHLEAVTFEEILRLVINIPPRYMKSYIVTIFWPVWEWIHKPQLRYMFHSYSSSLMEDHSISRRMILESPWFQARWGDRFRIVDDMNRKDEFHNTERGMMIANHTSTGKGANRVIVDDPHKPDDANSDTIRDHQVGYFKGTLSTRLNNKKRDAIVVVMQRLHEKDVSAKALEMGFTHVKLPGIAKRRTVHIFPRTNRLKIRDVGDILWPEREGKDEHTAMKIALGSYGYAGQYDQDPAPAEGGIIKRAWFKFYRMAPKLDEQIQSWDLTYKDKKENDLVAGQVWGRAGSGLYLLDYIAEQMSFTTTLSAIRTMTGKWPGARRKLIEDAANGPAIEDELKNEIGGILLVAPYGDKQERLHAISPYVEAGNVFLPAQFDPRTGSWIPYPWVEDFIRLVCTFPNAEHDDPVDAFTQAILALTGKRKKGRVAQVNTLAGQKQQQHYHGGKPLGLSR